MTTSTRRSILALAALLTASLLAGSCDDSAGPSPIQQGYFAVTPTFPSSSVAAGAIDLATIRFVLRRLSDSSVAKDTVISIAPGQDSVDLALTVPLFATGEVFILTLAIADTEGDTIFRGGPVDVTPTTEASTLDPVLVELRFTASGADAAELLIVPADSFTFSTEAVAFTAVALDSSGVPIPDPKLDWRSLDTAQARVPDSDSGTVVGGGTRGTARIVASIPFTVSDTATLRVQPLPTAITADSGNGQSAVVGAALPQALVARVIAGDGLGVSGLWVRFTQAQGDGSLSVDSALTDSTGRAATSLTLGTTATQHIVEATTDRLPSASATFTTTAQPGAPENIAESAGGGQVVAVGTAVPTPPAVLVTDANGNPVPGQSVTFELVSGGGAVTGATPTTDPAGVATVGSWTLGTTVGTNQLRAFLTDFAVVAEQDGGAAGRQQGGSTGDVTDTTSRAAGPDAASLAAAPSDTVVFTATATLGPPSVLALVGGDGQSNTVGTLLADSLVTRAEDSFGNVAPGVQVAWAVTLGNGAVSSDTVVTDGAGLAAVAWQLGTGAGTAHQVTAELVGTAATQTFGATALPGPADALAFVTQPVAAGADSIIAPAVQVEILDQFGNRVTTDNTTDVDIAITSGTGTSGAVLSGTTTRTAIAGLVTFDDLRIDLPGTGYTLDAQIPSLALATSAPFDIVPPAGVVAWLNPVSGNWSDGSKWSGGVPPGPTDTARITVDGAYTVTLDTDPTVAKLEIGGTTGSQVLDATARVLVVTNGIEILPSGSFIMDNGTLTASVVVDGSMQLDNGTVTGLVTIDPTGTLAAGGTAAQINGNVINLGAITISSFTSGQANFSVTGTLNNGVGALLTQGDPGTLMAGLANDGILVVSAAMTLDQPDAEHTNTGTINVSGGDLTVTQTGTAPTFTNTGAGAIVIVAGRRLLVDGGDFFYESGTLDGDGTLFFTNGTATFTPDFTTDSLDLGITIDAILNGPGTITNSPTSAITIGGATTSATFNANLVNQGAVTLRNSALNGALTTTSTSVLLSSGISTIAAGFVNNGVVNIDVNFSGPATLSVNGTFSNADGATLNGLAATSTLDAVLDNQGTVNAPLTIDRPSAAHSNTGIIQLLTADITVNQTGTAPTFTHRGIINVSPGQTLTFAGGSFDFDEAVANLDGNGTIVFSNTDSARFTSTGPLGFTTQGLNLTFDNTIVRGQLIANDGGSVLTVANTTFENPFNNAAVLDVQAGVSAFTGTFSHAGGAEVRGTGTLDLSGATVSAFDGAVNPGTSPGLLSLIPPAGLTLGANAVVTMELGADPTANLPGVDNDFFRSVTELLGLGGTLNVTLIAPYVPNGTETWPLLAGVSGAFAQVNLPPLDLPWTTFLQSDTLYLGPPPAAGPPTWTGAVSTNWFDAGNWDVGVVPNSETSDVVIPAGPAQMPVLTAGVVVRDLLVEAGASIDVVTFNLTAWGTSVNVLGPITGTGFVSLQGDPALAQGQFPNLEIQGNVALSGDLAVGDTVSISGVGARLDLNGRKAVVGGRFRTASSGELVMQNAADTLDIAGLATFDAAVVEGNLTDGDILLRGNFAVGSSACCAFNPTLNHRVTFVGTSPQSVSFSSPGNTGGATNNQRFREVIFDNPTTVTLSTDAWASANAQVSDGTLDLGANTFDAAGPSFSTALTGTVTMLDPAATLNVAGSAAFFGASTAGLLEAGTINVSGNLSQSGPDPEAFHAGGTHTVNFVGSGQHFINIQDSDIGPGVPSSHFANITVSGTGNVLLSTDVFAHSTLTVPTGVAATIADPAGVAGPGHTLAVGGVDVDGLTLSHIFFEYNGMATFPSLGTFTQFDNVTFNDYLDTEEQLRIVHPGAATPFTLDGLSFTVTPVTGAYIFAADSVADANTVTIDLTNSTPLNGSALTNTTGGAVVNWPGGGTALLVSHWAGDGNAVDSADGNDGTLVGGTTFATGLRNQAFSFDGVDDLVNVGNATNLQLSDGAFSVSAWTRANTANVDLSLVDKMTGTNANGWRLLRQQDNGYWFCLGGGASNGCTSGAATTVQTAPLAVATWYHVVAVKTLDSIAIYLDGALVQQKTLPAFTDNQANDLLIGGYAGSGSSSFMNGEIDDVRIYAGALTATQIDSIFASVPPPALNVWTGGAGDGLWSSAGNWSKNAVPTGTDSVVIDLAGPFTVTLDQAATVSSLIIDPATGTVTFAVGANTLDITNAGLVGPNGLFQLQTGTLTGAGTVSVEGIFEWPQGGMSGTGLTRIEPGGTLALSGTASKVLDTRTIENDGTVTWDGSGGILGSNGATILNNVGGTVDISSTGTASATLVNQGTVTRTTVNAGATSFDGDFVNFGTVDIQAGNFFMLGTSSWSGSATVVAGGLLAFSSGTHTWNDGFSATGPMLIEGTGTVTLPSAAAATVDQLSIIPSGTLIGDGSVSITGTLTWTGGTMSGAGTTQLASSATGTLSGGSAKSLAAGRVFSNAGTLAWTVGALDFAGGATLVNETGATLDVQGDVSVTASAGGGSVTNNGTLARSTSAGTAILSATNVPLVNNGVLQALTGTLGINGNLTHAAGALLQGTGVVDLSTATLVTTDGDIAPGTSPGVLTLAGQAWTLTTGATLTIELAGPPAGGAGVGYDEFRLTAGATVDGAMVVNTFGGFEPTVGDSFPVVTTTTGSIALGPTFALTLPVIVGVDLDTAFSAARDTLYIVARTPPPANLNTWTGGAVDGLWSSAGNWSKNAVPVGTDSVVIDLDGNYGIALDVPVTVDYLMLGAATGTQTLSQSGNTLTVNSLMNVGTNGVYGLNGGTFTGTADLTVGGGLFWTSGTMTGSGTVTVGSTGFAVLSGSGGGTTHVVDRAITFDGNVTWDAGAGSGFITALQNGNTITFGPTAQVAWAGDLGFNDGGGGGSIVNNGLITVTNAGDPAVEQPCGAIPDCLRAVVRAGVTFTNNALVDVVAGPLALENAATTATHTGDFNIAAGALLSVSGGTHTFSGPVGGTGILEVAGASAAFDGALGNVLLRTRGGDGSVNATWDGPAIVATAGTLSFANTATVTATLDSVVLTGATVIFNSGGPIGVTQLLQSGGTLAGADNVLLNGTGDWTGGIQTGTGTTVVAGAATLTWSNGTLNARTLSNQGTVAWTGSTLFQGAWSVTNAGLWDIQGDFTTGLLSSTGTFTSNGTLQKSAGAGTAAFTIPTVVNGILDIQSGTFAIGSSASLNGAGTLRGIGTLDATASDGTGALAGTIAPGDQSASFAGILSWTGVFDPDPSAVLAIDLGGTVAGTDHDRFDVSQTVVHDGTLQVTLQEPFIPTDGQRFPVMTFESATGEFATLAFPTVGTLVFDTLTVVDNGGTRDTLYVTVTDPFAAAPPGTEVIWQGDVNNSWADPANWLGSAVPTPTTNVWIPAGTPNSPTIVTGTTGETDTLVMETGAFLTVQASALLEVSGDLDAGYTSIIGAGTVRTIGTGMTVRGNMPTLEVTGDVTLADSTFVSGAVTVTGASANLDVGGQRITVTGNLVTDAGGTITMNAPGDADTIDVAGNATFGGGSTSGLLTAGVIEVAGGFSKLGGDTSAFSPTGTHRVVLDGSGAPQVVSFDTTSNDVDIRSHFQALRIENPFGISFTNKLTAFDVTVTGTAPIVGDTLGVIGLASAGDITLDNLIVVGDLSATGTYAVNLTEFAGTGQTIPATLPYADLEVSGTASFTGATTVVGKFEVSGKGNATVGANTVTVGGNFETTGSGTFTMTADAGTLDVSGSALIDGGNTNGLLTAGTLQIGDGFTQNNTTSNASFAASGAHRTRFVNAGLTINAIFFASPGAGVDQSHFRHVEFANNLAAKPNSSLNSTVSVTGNLDVTGGGQVGGAGITFVDGNLTVTGSTSEFATTTTVWIAGALTSTGTFAPTNTVFNGVGQTIPSGPNYDYNSVVVRGTAAFDPAAEDTIPGSLTVGAAGDLEINGAVVHASSFLTQLSGTLTMNGAADSLIVSGPVTFDGAGTAGLLTAGYLEVGGNFTQTSTNSPAAFAASGTHLTALTGGVLKTVTFADAGAAESHFNDLLVAMSDATVSAVDTIHVVGNLTVDDVNTVVGGSTLGGSGVVTVDGDVSLVQANILAAIATDTLRVGGKLDPGLGSLTGNTIEFFGTGQTIPVFTYTNVLVTDSLLFSNLGATTINNDLTIAGTKGLAHAGPGAVVTVGNNLSTTSGGALRMDDFDASITVNGDAIFNGGSTENRLTAGTLIANSDFFQSGGGVPTSFAASGSHEVLLNATGVVSFANPGTAASRFQDLRISGTGKSTFNSTTVVAGTMTLQTGGLAAIPTGTTLDINGALTQSSGATIEGTGTLDVADFTTIASRVFLNGDLSPGGSGVIDALNVRGHVAMGALARYLWDHDGTNTANRDLIAVTGSFEAGGTLVGNEVTGQNQFLGGFTIVTATLDADDGVFSDPGSFVVFYQPTTIVVSYQQF